MIFTPSNFLSLMRGPLALLFFVDNALWRSLVIILAMVTDSLDGYLARRYRMTSQLGAFLDPLMDKLFVITVLSIFFYESQLAIWEALAFISRDFAVIFFGIFLALKGSTLHFRSIWTGKLTTTLQFFVLLSLTYHAIIPTYLYTCFIILGALALVELVMTEKKGYQSP